MKRKSWRIIRLDRGRPAELLAAIKGLYQIDMDAFEEDEQYGLDLANMALCQPSAFWVAKRGQSYVAYFSMFDLKSAKLCNELMMHARRGDLDLPKPSALIRELVPNPFSPDKRRFHLYVDALATRALKLGLTLTESRNLTNDLLQEAAAQFSVSGTASMCTITTRPEFERFIAKYAPELKFIGRREPSVTARTLYRQLYAYNGSGEGLALLGKKLSRIGWGRICFEVLQSWEVEPRVEILPNGTMAPSLQIRIKPKG